MFETPRTRLRNLANPKLPAPHHEAGRDRGCIKLIGICFSAANLRFLSFVAASSFRNLKFKSRTRFIELLVVLRFRSSYRNMPRALTNFGIGPLVVLRKSGRRRRSGR